MKQPKIEIKDKYKNWGIYDVMSITWHADGFISHVIIDFYEDDTQSLVLQNHQTNKDKLPVLIDPHGNLSGTFVKENKKYE
jgi:hypothetical protein